MRHVVIFKSKPEDKDRPGIHLRFTRGDVKRPWRIERMISDSLDRAYRDGHTALHISGLNQTMFDQYKAQALESFEPCLMRIGHLTLVHSCGEIDPSLFTNPWHERRAQ